MPHERHVKSVSLTAHSELYNWVQDTLPNFSGTCVKVLYALRAYQQRTNSSGSALDALLDDLARAGGPSSPASASDGETLRQIIRQELQRALLAHAAPLPAVEPEPDDEEWQEITTNLEAVL